MYYFVLCSYFIFFFFFQAEDGIRDVAMTGVQTCALPISRQPARGRHDARRGARARLARRLWHPHQPRGGVVDRSEEHSLNSSHGYISYAVFCLKKKKKNKKKDKE